MSINLERCKGLPGAEVDVGGVKLVIPKLNIRVMREFQTDLDELLDPDKVQKLGVTGYALKAIPLLAANLKRNYPGITQEDVEDLLPVSEVAPLIRVLLKVSGAEEGQKETPLDEVRRMASAGEPLIDANQSTGRRSLER